MIAQVRGKVLHRGTDEAVIEVGGVGLTVQLAVRTLATLEVGTEATLTTDLIVREDSLTLYGFADSGEREVFRTVQTVTGIGPRLALTMLATLTADQIREAIINGDEPVLTTVSGLGRKTAQRLIVDLKDRIGPPVTSSAAAVPATASWRLQVSAALTGLGWSAPEAQTAIAAVAARPDAGDLAVADALKLALQVLDHTPAVTP
jgi:holliday junction DNA helicase RuvA